MISNTAKHKRFFFYVSHPAHVHFFHGIIRQLLKDGHLIHIALRKKDITLELADKLGLMPYVVMSITPGGNIFGLAVELLLTVFKFLKFTVRQKIDLCLAIGGESISIVRLLTGIPCFAFTDTEHAIASNMFSFNLATRVFVPSCFFGRCKKNTIKYNSVHELAYLHPEVFKPNENVLKKYDLLPEEVFFIVRCVSWKAAHDIGQKGLTENGKRQVMDELLKKGKVLLSVEGEVKEWMKPYHVRFDIEDIHHLLYFASGYVGEGATMATEAAILGTPSVFVNTLKMGSTNELSKGYGLMQLCKGEEEVLRVISNWHDLKMLKAEWALLREKYLQSKVNTCAYVLDQINEYVSR